MATLKDIEAKTEKYAAQREALAGTVAALEDERRDLLAKYLPRLRKLVAGAKDAHAALAAGIGSSPELFEKPRTRTLHGVKVGLTKGKGKIEWDDEEKVIARIRAQLPKTQVDLLVRVEESVYKQAVYDLTAEDLKRLGIRVTGNGDVVVIKDTAGEVDKLVEALLKDAPEEVGA